MTRFSFEVQNMLLQLWRVFLFWRHDQIGVRISLFIILIQSSTIFSHVRLNWIYLLCNRFFAFLWFRQLLTRSISWQWKDEWSAKMILKKELFLYSLSLLPLALSYSLTHSLSPSFNLSLSFYQLRSQLTDKNRVFFVEKGKVKKW